MDRPAAKTMAEIIPLYPDQEIFPGIFDILLGYQYPSIGYDHAMVPTEQDIARIVPCLLRLLSAKVA
jgi:hypothetical protein